MGPTAVWGWGPPALKTMTSWQRALATGCSLQERGPLASSLLPCTEPLPRVSERSVLRALLLSPVVFVALPCHLHRNYYEIYLNRVVGAPRFLVGLDARSKVTHLDPFVFMDGFQASAVGTVRLCPCTIVLTNPVPDQNMPSNFIQPAKFAIQVAPSHKGQLQRWCHLHPLFLEAIKRLDGLDVASKHKGQVQAVVQAANVDATLTRLKRQQALQEEKKRLAADAAAAAERAVQEGLPLDPEFTPSGVGSAPFGNSEAEDRAASAAQLANQISQVQITISCLASCHKVVPSDPKWKIQ